MRAIYRKKQVSPVKWLSILLLGQIVLHATMMTSELPAGVASAKAAKAGRDGDNYLAMVPTPPTMADGVAFVKKMQDAADSYKSYYFEYKMTALKHGQAVEEGKFWFKKPRLIRLEEVGNFRKGCVAILQSSGKVKAKSGGALGVFTVDLAANSTWLKSANGYPMVKSDLSSLAAALKQFLAEGKTAKVSTAPITISSQPGKVNILEIYQPSSNQIYKRVAVDSDTTLPVEWWDFESGKLVSHSVWKTFQGNIDINDALFQDINRK